MSEQYYSELPMIRTLEEARSQTIASNAWVELPPSLVGVSLWLKASIQRESLEGDLARAIEMLSYGMIEHENGLVHTGLNGAVNGAVSWFRAQLRGTIPWGAEPTDASDRSCSPTSAQKVEEPVNGNVVRLTARPALVPLRSESSVVRPVGSTKEEP